MSTFAPGILEAGAVRRCPSAFAVARRTSIAQNMGSQPSARPEGVSTESGFAGRVGFPINDRGGSKVAAEKDRPFDRVEDIRRDRAEAERGV